MKAMIIAENEDVIERVSSVVKTAGYDTIIYHWLLKALDNMEEISPHLIVVSTKEYPRHWKTLAQFATTDFGGYKPQIILYTDGPLPEEELKKAETLHVRGAFSSVSVEGLDELRAILARNDDIYAGDYDNTAKEATVLNEEQSPAESVQEVQKMQDAADIEPLEPAELIEESAVEEIQAVEEPAIEEIPTVDGILQEQETPPETAGSETTTFPVDFSDNAGQKSESSENDIEALPDLILGIPDENDSIESVKESLFTDTVQPVSIPCSLVFTNPETGALVTGISRNYDGATVEFEPDFDIPQLKEGTEIPSVSLKTGETITAFKAWVVSASSPFVLKLA
ncbi:MAG: hypothetical protein K6G80_10680 [Treponema sp.]|nr:hypothetical protein [Treponema sp.]